VTLTRTAYSAGDLPFNTQTAVPAAFRAYDAQNAGDAVSRITAAGLGPVTLELMDQFTIAAVDDWQGLGLDREAAGMLLIESDLPAAAADAELAAAQEACEAAVRIGARENPDADERSDDRR